MSFTFGFQINDEDREVLDVEGQHILESPDAQQCPPPLPAKEILVSSCELHPPDSEATCQLRLHDGEVLRYITSPGSTTYQELSAPSSDLIPNVYEGGMKVWECSVDLVQYLSETALSWSGLKVLELGCGAGLPGILALAKGSETVHFQDYNEEVLQRVTIPNIMLNTGLEVSTARCQCFAGDWSGVQKMLTEELTLSDDKYDIILTSETIYNTDSYQKLHDLMKSVLTPHGTVYLAAKTHYFGVGGGTRLFEEFLQKEDFFHSEVCKVYSEGVNREILKIEIKKS